jgi:phosphatidyl-myo-inositol dimannoside synthase
MLDAHARSADVVVLGAAWPLAELAPLVRRSTRAPIVGVSHGLEAGMVRAGLGAVVARALDRLDTVTTISDFTQSAIASRLGAVRVRRVAPGVDVERFAAGADGAAARRRWGVPMGVPVVGCVSRLVPRKGQDVLIDAWPALSRRHPDANLVIAGEGPDRSRLARAVRRLGPVAARVHLVGRVDEAHLAAAMAAFDVFALPCRTRWGGLDVEGLGIVLLEAQAAGRPVVVGRSGGAPEAVAGPSTGTVIDGRDRDGLVEALDRWLGDASARAIAASDGPTWVGAGWTWDAVATRFAAVLDETVAAGPRGPRR